MAVSFIVPRTSAAQAGSPWASPAPRPHLVVLAGGRSVRTTAHRTFVARRLVALVGLGLAMWLAVSVAGLVVSAVAPERSAREVSGGAASVGAASGLPRTYQVRAGDTLWGIAGGLDVDVDRRVIVEILGDANGGPVIQPGQVLEIPAQLAEI